MLSSGIKLVLLGVATFFTSVEFPDLTDQPQDSAVHDPGINRCGTGEEYVRIDKTLSRKGCEALHGYLESNSEEGHVDTDASMAIGMRQSTSPNANMNVRRWRNRWSGTKRNNSTIPQSSKSMKRDTKWQGVIREGDTDTTPSVTSPAVTMIATPDPTAVLRTAPTTAFVPPTEAPTELEACSPTAMPTKSPTGCAIKPEEVQRAKTKGCLAGNAQSPLLDEYMFKSDHMTGQDKKSSSGFDLEACLSAATGAAQYLCSLPWAITVPMACLVLCCISLLYAAGLPLRYGGTHDPTHVETMSFWRRLLAVFTLALASGGAVFLFFIILGYMMYFIWRWQESTWMYLPLSVGLFMLRTWVKHLKPLVGGAPANRANLAVFGLWRQFFEVHVVYDGGAQDEIKRLLKEKKKFLVGLVPHAIVPFVAILGNSILGELCPEFLQVGGVVASALLKTPVLRNAVSWLGVRAASRGAISAMFHEGCRAVGVVTGGIREMFVSSSKERLVAPRRSFAEIALKGGHSVMFIIVFGASRTHVLIPGMGSDGLQRLSQKLRLPVLLFHGSCGLVPYREKMVMVIGKPREVRQIRNPKKKDISKLYRGLQEDIRRVYNFHRPRWENRPLVMIP